MKKAVVASSILGKVALSVAVVVALGAVAKAEEIKAPTAKEKKEQRAKNEKAINKLLEDVPTDKELLKGVELKNHRVVEEFSCQVALADRKLFQKQLSNAKGLSQAERNSIRRDLDTVSSMLHEHKCS